MQPETTTPAPTPADRESAAFKRENRYIVVKRKHLTEYQEARIRTQLEKFGITGPDCVVVERDWPEYEVVWRMIEDRVAGAQGGDGPKPWDYLTPEYQQQADMDGTFVKVSRQALDETLAAFHTHRLQAEARMSRMREALEEIVTPILFMKKRAKEQGHELSSMAYPLSNDVEYLRSIARAALNDGGGNG